MIVFDLKCKNGHKFEGWFKDSQAFNEQLAQKLVSCPSCNSSAININHSSVTIMGKESRASDKAKGNEITYAKALQLLHEYIDKNFDDVGNKFAEVALKIHYGEEEKRNIKGTTTAKDEQNLKEEGVQFFKIPLPKLNS
jgi:hypothetical protein